MSCFRWFHSLAVLVLPLVCVLTHGLNAGEASDGAVENQKPAPTSPKEKKAGQPGLEDAAGKRSPNSYDGIIVQEITVVGNVRLATKTILALLHTRVGAHFKAMTWDEDWHRLIASGQFVKVVPAAPVDAPKGLRLSLSVVEMPLVSSIELQGGDERLHEQLRVALKTSVGQPLSVERVKRDAAGIKTHLQLKGYEGVSVEPKIVTVKAADAKSATTRKIVMAIHHRALKSGGKFLPNEP